MGKVRRLASMANDQSRSSKEKSSKRQQEGDTVHFGALMDICHLKNSELEPKFQKDKGRVVLRGDIVKNDSGSCAVCTEQVRQHHK